jgi:glyoxylase-like metal-dependent hydrolase (beta-lactamase superfamily II)
MLSGRHLIAVVAALLAGFVGLPATAQRSFDDVEVRAEKVADGVYMLQGVGGNIGVSVGEDGIFLVDDQYAPLTEKIKAALADISDRPLRFVLNTHWHGDHTGGNENLGQTGVLILAHDDVRSRMSVEQFVEVFDRTVPPSPKAALPVVTFSDTVTLHLNDDEIHAFHVPPAHTDGDSIVHFRRANVLHTGDVFWNGMYPVIDYSAGGSMDGMIGAVETALRLAGPQTRVIPGHGDLSDREGLVAFLQMLRGIRERIVPLVRAGKSLEEIQAAKPTAQFDSAPTRSRRSSARAGWVRCIRPRTRG